jgi:hypothetical protein
VSGCCFDGEVDCMVGDDRTQADERHALVTLFNSTNGPYWQRQVGSKWLTDIWICYWDGVECSGEPGNMHVTSIVIRSNGLSGIIPAELADLKYLTVLDLSDNGLVGEIPKELVHLPLQTLKLRNNQLQGQIPSGLSSVSSLQILDLGFNFLTGTLSRDFSAERTSVTCAGNCMCSECLPLRTPNDLHNSEHLECPSCLA